MDIDDFPCVVQIQDTSGQDEFLLLRSGWINDSEAFVLVYSIDNEISFQEIPKIYSDIVKHKGKDPHPIIALAANKCDLKSRSVSIEEGADLAKKNSFQYFECSGKKKKKKIIFFLFIFFYFLFFFFYLFIILIFFFFPF